MQGKDGQNSELCDNEWKQLNVGVVLQYLSRMKYFISFSNSLFLYLSLVHLNNSLHLFLLVQHILNLSF